MLSPLIACTAHYGNIFYFFQNAIAFSLVCCNFVFVELHYDFFDDLLQNGMDERIVTPDFLNNILKRFGVELFNGIQGIIILILTKETKHFINFMKVHFKFCF